MEHLDIIVKVIAILTFAGSLLAFCVKVWKELKHAKEGDLCLLRQKMLDIYYANKDRKKLRQYEAQNFVLMYKAYKARGGNSFIDEVYLHVTEWELET